MEIVSCVHVVRDRFANAYLIIDPDGLTLIDTGLARSGKPILAYVAAMGFAFTDLKRIIVTHADGDHAGGAGALKALSGARVYASPAEAAALADGCPSRELKLRPWLLRLVGRLFPWIYSQPVTVDEMLSHDQRLPVLGELRVLATPGHTPGHTSLYAPQERILFSGDSLIGDRHGNLHLSYPDFTWDQAQALQSARLQARLGAQIVCPGHGRVVMNAARKFPAHLL